MGTKIVFIVLGAYVFYYIGNIVYDLFLYKEPAKEEEEVQSVAVVGTEIPVSPTSVGIEDVEELNTPDQNRVEDFLYPTSTDENQNTAELQALQQKFKEEQQLENPELAREQQIKEKKEKFKNILNYAESHVKVVANIDGEKIYNSTYANQNFI